MQITRKELKYIHLIDKKLRELFPVEFQGFNIHVKDNTIYAISIGILPEEALLREVKKMNLDAMIPNKKKTIQKLKELGFDNEDIEIIGIREDKYDDREEELPNE